MRSGVWSAALLAAGVISVFSHATLPPVTDTSTVASGYTNSPSVTGRSLFLRNCAHCHADNATGDEGPDLHGLSRTDAWLANRIRNGKKGQMPAFGEKFKQADLEALISYLHTLE